MANMDSMRKRWVLLSLLFAACSPGNYECGTPVEGSTEIHECTRTGEVCICATHSCAKVADTKQCASGYEYVDSPFVQDEKIEGKCVPVEIVGHRIEATSTVKKCDAPVDAGIDASGGES